MNKEMVNIQISRFLRIDSKLEITDNAGSS